MFWHRYSFIAAFFFLPVAHGAIPPFVEPQKNETIRVLLGTFQRFSLSGYDLVLNDSIRFDGNSAFSLRCGREKSGQSFIEFGAGKKAINSLDVFSPSGFLRVNGRLYRNAIRVVAKDGQCSVINTLSLEKYLSGLLTKEMSPSWPIEALKAQAVASRSYAIYQKENNRHRDYDLESTTQDQVYDGASSETPRSTQAVIATQGIVLASGLNPLKAYFHANCGGMTEVPEQVWGSETGKFRTVVCPYHHETKRKQAWTINISRPQIENAIRKIAGSLPTQFLRVAHLETGAPDPSHRLNDVLVSDTDGNSLVLSANAFRNALGNTRIKSTAFDIKPEGAGYKISGIGFGHGVGMCQVGAKAMADEGRGYQDILRFYYPLAKIQRL